MEEFDLKQMEEETREMLKLCYLSKDNCVFEKTSGGFVSLKINGEETYSRVQIFCTFPFTAPYFCLSVREATEKAKEIGIIRNLETDMDENTVAMIKEQIRLRYFTPVITKIKSVKDEYGFAYWDVVTNYGSCKFAIRMNGGAITHLSDKRILITDLDENRFEIQDVTALTTKEQKKISVFI